MSGPAQEALVRWAEDATANGSANYPAWSKRIEQVRSIAAGMIGATPEEIAYLTGESFVAPLAADGGPLILSVTFPKPRAEVLAPTGSF